jgi:hypothetical protein
MLDCGSFVLDGVVGFDPDEHDITDKIAIEINSKKEDFILGPPQRFFRSRYEKASTSILTHAMRLIQK